MKFNTHHALKRSAPQAAELGFATAMFAVALLLGTGSLVGCESDDGDDSSNAATQASESDPSTEGSSSSDSTAPSCDDACAALSECGEVSECLQLCEAAGAGCRTCLGNSSECGTDCVSSCIPGSDFEEGGEEGDDEDDDCDPAGCDDYCATARCLWPGDLDGSDCRKACNEKCGDGFFDGVDGDLLACEAQNAEVGDFTCEDSHACCDDEFTNQICPD